MIIQNPVLYLYLRWKTTLKKIGNKEGEESVSQLRKELQEARLLAEAYCRMIEIAEQEFKIKIVKKSNAK